MSKQQKYDSFVVGQSKSEGRSMNREICGECKWHTYEEIDRGFVCTNADSPYCTEWTGYTDACECFEQRGVE